MAIPFFAIFLSASGERRINHFNLDNNIRIQIVNYGVLGRPLVQIVKDNLLFDQIKYEDQDEIQKNDSTWFELRDAKNVILTNETANSITVKYFFENDTLNATHKFTGENSFRIRLSTIQYRTTSICYIGFFCRYLIYELLLFYCILLFPTLHGSIALRCLKNTVLNLPAACL